MHAMRMKVEREDMGPSMLYMLYIIASSQRGTKDGVYFSFMIPMCANSKHIASYPCLPMLCYSARIFKCVLNNKIQEGLGTRLIMHGEVHV